MNNAKNKITYFCYHCTERTINTITVEDVNEGKLDAIYFWRPDPKDEGWSCAVCKNRIGKNDILDSMFIVEKIQSILLTLQEKNIIHLHNVDLIEQAIEAACKAENNTSQLFIASLCIEASVQRM